MVEEVMEADKRCRGDVEAGTSGDAVEVALMSHEHVGELLRRYARRLGERAQRHRHSALHRLSAIRRRRLYADEAGGVRGVCVDAGGADVQGCIRRAVRQQTDRLRDHVHHVRVHIRVSQCA